MSTEGVVRPATERTISPGSVPASRRIGENGRIATADDMRRDRFSIGIRQLRPIGHFPSPQHGDPVGQRHDFAQLVTDENNGGAALAQAPQQFEQVVDLLRRKHRRRLVENEDSRAPPQQSQDFNELLNMHRRTAGATVPVDIDTGLIRKRLTGRASLCPIDAGEYP